MTAACAFAALALLLASSLTTSVRGLAVTPRSLAVPRHATCWTSKRHTTFTTKKSLLYAQVDEGDGDGDGESEPNESEPSPTDSPPLSSPRVVSSRTSSSSSSSLAGLTREQKQLDPLVVSLTRMDDDTINAPRTNVPLWGELILDRSLLVLLPVATFAVVGFFMSVYVAVNSQDEFVDAVVETARQQSQLIPSYTSSSGVVDESACRGLCSNQEQDLQSLAAFLESLRRK